MEQNKPTDNFFTKAFRDHKVPSWWAVAGFIFLFISFPICIICFAISLYILYKEKNPGGKFTLVKLIVWIAIIGIFSSIVLAALNSARLKGQAELDSTNQNNQTTNAPVASTQSDQTKNSSGPASSFSDGTYIVNKDINPGTYKNSDSSNGCYWGRLSNFTGNNDIIASDFTYANAIVTIKSTDVGFKTTRCGTWSQIQTPVSTVTTKSTYVAPATNIKPTPIVTPTPPPTLVAPTPQAPAPFNISGTGQQASQQFSLQTGLSVFNLSYSGNDYFSAWLVDQNGNNVDLLANTTGGFSGSVAVGIQATGQYLLNVQGTKSWNVNITQPRPTSAPSPTSFSGNSPEATSLFHLSSGLHVFNMNYSSSGYFSVWLIDQNGNNVDLLANETGSFNGSKAEGIDNDGIYLLNVQASGPWTITIQ